MTIWSDPSSDDCMVPPKNVQSKTEKGILWKLVWYLTCFAFCAGWALYLMWQLNCILEFINKFCKKKGKELMHWSHWETPLFIFICCYCADTNITVYKLFFWYLEMYHRVAFHDDSEGLWICFLNEIRLKDFKYDTKIWRKDVKSSVFPNICNYFNLLIYFNLLFKKKF